jgi:hypothetical protein
MLTDQVNVDHLTEQAFHVIGTHTYRYYQTLFSLWITCERSFPFRSRKLGREVVWGEDGDGAGSLPGCSIHVMHKVAACSEVPGLDHSGIAFGFQLPGNPFGPALVSVGIADEEVFSGYLRVPGALAIHDSLRSPSPGSGVQFCCSA